MAAQRKVGLLEFHELHGWDVTPAEAVALQESLRGLVSLEDAWSPGRVRYVAGADVGYDPVTGVMCAAVVVLSYPELVGVAEAWATARPVFPYIPGLLAFREGPALVEAFRRLGTVPDVVFFDGQGVAHPRGLGIASHMGLWLGRPTVGVAKTPLVGEYEPPAERAGSVAPLRLGGRMVGAVLRTRQRVRPVFVSPGHLMSVRGAVALTLACVRGYRLPEPLRRAHILAVRLRKEG